MKKFLLKLIKKIDSFTYYLFYNTPKFHDNYAFNDEDERKKYYEIYSPFTNDPIEKFSIKKIVYLFLKSIFIYILFLGVFILCYILCV